MAYTDCCCPAGQPVVTAIFWGETRGGMPTSVCYAEVCGDPPLPYRIKTVVESLSYSYTQNYNTEDYEPFCPGTSTTTITNIYSLTYGDFYDTACDYTPLCEGSYNYTREYLLSYDCDGTSCLRTESITTEGSSTVIDNACVFSTTTTTVVDDNGNCGGPEEHTSSETTSVASPSFGVFERDPVESMEGCVTTRTSSWTEEPTPEESITCSTSRVTTLSDAWSVSSARGYVMSQLPDWTGVESDVAGLAGWSGSEYGGTIVETKYHLRVKYAFPLVAGFHLRATWQEVFTPEGGGGTTRTTRTATGTMSPDVDPDHWIYDGPLITVSAPPSAGLVTMAAEHNSPPSGQFWRDLSGSLWIKCWPDGSSEPP